MRVSLVSVGSSKHADTHATPMTMLKLSSISRPSHMLAAGEGMSAPLGVRAMLEDKKANS